MISKTNLKEFMKVLNKSVVEEYDMEFGNKYIDHISECMRVCGNDIYKAVGCFIYVYL